MNRDSIITITSLNENCGVDCSTHAHINLENIMMGSSSYDDVSSIFSCLFQDIQDTQDFALYLEQNMLKNHNATIYWQKIVDEAKIPTKREEDAGFDIYTISEPCTLKPFETKKFFTGIRSAFSKDFWIEIKERGSTGSIGLSVRSGVIDSGYRGEWIIVLTNLNPFPIEFSKEATEVQRIEWDWWFLKGKTRKIIYPLSKAIAQAVLVPLPSIQCKPWDEEKIAASERGETGFGASGK